jgi:tRNA/tmRNA/rRNA uracil-C5-methylase (TrmA/RlmC/RlmD family)
LPIWRGRLRRGRGAHDSYARRVGEWLGRRVELDVTNIAHGGVSVARLDGRVVFVSDAIPGERITALISDDSKSSFWRGETVEVLTPSIHRQEHVWQEAGLDRAPDDRAGGAEFGHIALGFQRELKRQVLTESLERMAGIQTDVTVDALPGDDESRGTGWRTRVRLHNDESGWPGPYAARSHRVVRVTTLPLATTEVNRVAPLDQRFAAGTSIDLVDTGGEAHISSKAATIIERVGEREFHLADGGFWQVHRHAAHTLSAAVRAAIDPARFDPLANNLDLYGGVGLFAAAIVDGFGESTTVTTVEADRAASGFATSNLAGNPNVSAVAERVERWLKFQVSSGAGERDRYRRATAVLDPPRSGAGRAVIDSLTTLAPAQLIYVACDPVAFARDAGLLAKTGYRLSALAAFDLFPNTHHVEAVGTFLREDENPQ